MSRTRHSTQTRAKELAASRQMARAGQFSVIFKESYLVSRIGNSLFFIGLILLTLAAIVGMPAALPIGVVSLTLICLGAWLWSKKPEAKSKQVPLSQQPAKNKILAAIPAVVLLIAAVFSESGKVLISTTGLFLLGYAMVGLIEIIFWRQLSGASAKWESLAGWKKFLISTVVIIVALGVFIAAMPVMARIIYE